VYDLEAAERLAAQLFRLVRLVERTKAQAAAADPGEHLERATFGLLVQLVDCGPRRTTALAEAVYTDASTVSRQVNQLVRLGLVERQADPDDGRATLLAATERGRACLAKAREQRNQRVAELVADWSPADRQTLTELLDRFNTVFEHHRLHQAGQESA
jgi:DNA-binding MarR family transcriptional regulator